MYTENIAKDILLFSKAVVTNQLARFTPTLYVKLTRQTGRAHEEETSKKIGDYLIQCFKDYFTQLEIEPENIEEYLHNKVILEYGPGDILGVALLMYAHGAQQIHCVDRFPLEKTTEKNIEVYSHILNSLNDEKRKRAESIFLKHGDPGSGFDPDKILYLVTANGFSGEKGTYDLIISRAVLEHVNNLDGTFNDIKTALKQTGTSIHQVDLKSHNLDRYKELDFLSWPSFAYRLMYSHKGFPNRWRIDRYQNLIQSHDLECTKFACTQKLDIHKAKEIRHKLASPFQKLSGEELSWLGFWMVLRQNTQA